MNEDLNQAPEPSLRTERAVRVPQWVAPVLGLFIIGVMIVLGGLYLWGSMLTPEDLVPIPARINSEPETVRAKVDVEIAETVSPSHELGAIEADLDGTLLGSSDADMQAMEAEMDTYMANIGS